MYGVNVAEEWNSWVLGHREGPGLGLQGMRRWMEHWIENKCSLAGMLHVKGTLICM